MSWGVANIRIAAPRNTDPQQPEEEERYMGIQWSWRLLAVSVFVLAGCTSGDSPDDDSKTAGPNACLNERDGAGDLEVTESVLTTINPDASSEFVETFAIEVTNRSKTQTAVMAGLVVVTVDSDGKSTGDADAKGRVEYVAPGESQYFASASFEPSNIRANEVEISLPRPLLKEGWDNPRTYWMSEREVDYPEELLASDIELTEDGHLSFEVDNDSKNHFKNVEAQILLHDSKGKLLGGRNTIPTALWEELRKYDWRDIDVPPGRSEVSMDPFPDGIPEATDLSKTEVQLRIPTDITELDPDCTFDFSEE